MKYETINDWLDEQEGYGLRAERLPPEALEWVEEAWRLGEISMRERAARTVEMFAAAETETIRGGTATPSSHDLVRWYDALAKVIRRIGGPRTKTALVDDDGNVVNSGDK